uniref:Nucleolus and neural progenitor protein-like N-terminal domain-containing protein n=1 Tax=Kalanchoe fedtschenkoi TaxID=63787 RepID=A0A7N0RCU6_KALFE
MEALKNRQGTSNTEMPADSQQSAEEERLNSFLAQLQSEYAILDRIVYKNKNQHRRGSYFQYLMKVRRDLRLLQSVKLVEILTQCFYVIDGKKSKQKVSALESLKKSKRDSGKYNFMDRALGAARLLSQMVEPMLKAASKISTLLAQSFFVSFSVTVLAIIARLRVLVQQILLDVVSVFNAVSSIFHKRQSIKIIQEGVEVFREYYPNNEEMITLECVWETDKYVLIEKTQKIEIKTVDLPPSYPTVKYTSIEAFLEDDEPRAKKVDPDVTKSLIDTAIFSWNKERENETNEDHCVSEIKPSAHNESTSSSAFTIPEDSNPPSSKRKFDSKSRVAFVSVKKPSPSTDNGNNTLLQKVSSSSEDPLMLITSNPKSSVF